MASPATHSQIKYTDGAQDVTCEECERPMYVLVGREHAHTKRTTYRSGGYYSLGARTYFGTCACGAHYEGTIYSR